MWYRLLVLCAVTLFHAGCAIHPLPEDVTRFDTNAIVLHIRCEARGAIQHATTAFLLNPKIPIPEPTRRAAQALADGNVRYEDFDPNKLDSFSRFYLLKYENSAIAYDFTFDILEDDSVGANVNFLTAVTNGTFGLTLGATSDRQRQTIRNFRVSDTFGELRMMTLCNNPDQSANNYIYPVTGSIGLDEVVRTFVDLNEFNRLSATDTSKVPVLADTFSFLTMISGTATPTLTLVPAHPGRFNLTSASIPLTASRRDTHKVVVAMSLPIQKAELARARAAIGILSVSPVINKSARTPAEERALIEIDNQKTINSLNNIALKPQ
jgi:GR25 family glycosyltransferase involved in LPS biosynthesis